MIPDHTKTPPSPKQTNIKHMETTTKHTYEYRTSHSDGTAGPWIIIITIKLTIYNM